MKIRKFLVLLLCFILVLSLIACGKSEQDESKDEVLPETGDKVDPAKEKERVVKYGILLESVSNVDPQKNTINTHAEIAMHVCDSLLKLDTDTLEISPNLLAKMPEVSEDGLTYTCELKPGIKFHNGSPLTSKDVEYTFNRFFNPETKCVYTWLCDMIKGSKDMLEGKSDKLEGFKVIDDLKFEFTLDIPYSPFIAAIACPQLGIYPHKECEEAGDSWGHEVYIGTGPFIFEEFVPKNKIVLAKNKNYHLGPAQIDKVIYMDMDPNTALLEFENGSIDVCNIDLKLVGSYKDNPQFKEQMREVSYLGIITLAWNQTREPLNDVKVREALSIAIDRETLVNGFMQGNAKVAKTFIPPRVPGHNEGIEPIPYDVERAKKLLSEAGYPDGITVTISVSEKSSVVPALEVIKEQYKKANIDLVIQKLDHAANLEMGRAGKKQATTIIWYADIVDADNFFYSILYKDAGIAFSTHYFNDKFDSLADKARSISDLDERIKIYYQLEEMVSHQDFIVAPLYHPISYYLVSDSFKEVYKDNSSLMHFYTSSNK